MTARANLAASVTARLLDRAQATGETHQNLLTSYCLERFLYRLGESDRRDRFVLKGAMLLRVWSDRPYRATRDLDLLRRGDGSFDAIRGDLRAIPGRTGRIPRVPRRCGPSRDGRASSPRRLPPTSSRACCMPSSHRSSRICARR